MRGAVADFYPYSSLRAFNAAKRNAAHAVKHALASGALTKQPCVTCGRLAAEAHHDDHANPLDIIWLCRFHHRRRDAALREARRASLKAAARAALPLAYLKRQARLQPVPFAAGLSHQQRRRSLVTRDGALALVVQATLAVSDAMDLENITELQLARRVKISRQCVNATFAGGFRTLKVIAAYADALGYEASVVFRKRPIEAVAS